MIELLALTILSAVLLISFIYQYAKCSDLQKMLDLVQDEINYRHAQCEIDDILEEIENNCKRYQKGIDN